MSEIRSGPQEPMPLETSGNPVESSTSYCSNYAMFLMFFNSQGTV